MTCRTASTLQLAYEVWQGGRFVGRQQTLTVAADMAKAAIIDAWQLPVTIRIVRGWIDRTDGEFKVVAVVDEMKPPV